MAGTDNLDWGDLEPDHPGYGGPDIYPNPFSITSDDGLTVKVTEPGGKFERIDQGPYWGGNFSTGDELLWTSGTCNANGQGNGPIIINFGTNTIEAFGLQIEGNFLGAFTAQLERLIALAEA